MDEETDSIEIPKTASEEDLDLFLAKVEKALVYKDLGSVRFF